MRRLVYGTLALAFALTLVRVDGASQESAAVAGPAKKASVTKNAFGRLPDGQAIESLTLTNSQGVELKAITYGGIIVSLKVPDRAGRLDDVVLGHDDLKAFLEKPAYFGAIIGRYGNRIAKGRFTLDGKTHQLATNNVPNHLHGGKLGFDKVVWKAQPFESKNAAGIVFTRTSADGEENYPGKLDARVTYTLNDHNELTFEYFATTDKPTIVNLTQHSYFNLAGDGKRDILDHQLTIDADLYTPVDATLIPTGVKAKVAGTPFDFTKPVAIGARIGLSHEQLKHGQGYDHNFVVNRKGDGLSRAARLVEPTSGRTMDIHTTEPGLQFYSGNFLDGTITGKAGRVYKHRFGLCLETQHFPDSPNQPGFPATTLRPGQEYRSKTVLAFGVQQ